jgi:flagellar basal body rod protein FlgG
VLTAQPGGLAVASPAAAVQPNQGGSTTQGRVAAEPGNEAARAINLRDRVGPVSITEKGEVFVGEDLVAKLSVAEFTDTKKLRKSGAGLFDNPDPQNIKNPERSSIKQGMIETSNVNPAEEMTNMIKANRAFEHDLKALKTYNDLMGREVNDIGKL